MIHSGMGEWVTPTGTSELSKPGTELFFVSVIVSCFRNCENTKRSAELGGGLRKKKKRDQSTLLFEMTRARSGFHTLL